MSKKQYPQVDSRRMVKPPNSRGPCNAHGCTKPATWHVEIQFNWFRGEDEGVNCCDEHCTVKSISSRDDVKKFIRQFPPEAFK